MRRRRQPAMSIVKRTTTRLAVITAAAMTAAVVAASPSFAVYTTDALATVPAGYAYFNSDTQVISLHDSHADGYGVRLRYFRYDLANIGPYYMWNREGNGTTLYRTLHMPYGTEIRLYICSEDDGIVIYSDCSAKVTGHAGPAI